MSEKKDNSNWLIIIVLIFLVIQSAVSVLLYFNGRKEMMKTMDSLIREFATKEARKTQFIIKYKNRIKKANPKLSDLEAVIILSNAYEQIEAYADLTPELLLAVYDYESSFNPKAVSNKYAIGVGQMIMPTAILAANYLGMAKFDLKKPADNVKLSAFWLALCVQHFGVRDGLAAYNAGNRIHLGYLYADNVLELSMKWK